MPASLVDGFGTKEFKDSITSTYMKDQGLKGKATDTQKEDALLWFANTKSDKVYKDSGLKGGKGNINPGDTLDFKSLVPVSGDIEGFKGGLDFEKIDKSA